MSTQHVHPCPECYEDIPCFMDCDIEPELSEPGKLTAHHVVCDVCERRIEAKRIALFSSLESYR